MSITALILLLIIVINSLFAIKFLQDLIKNQQELLKEKINNLPLAISSFVIFFFSSFGVSDFAISTILYRKQKWVADKMLPGTLNAQCVLPVAAMALAFISVIEVDVVTLSTCIIAQVIGAYFGPRFVVNLPPKTIRIFIASGLIVATLFILAGKFNFISNGGDAIALSGTKLVIAAILLCIFGALNNIGIGSYAPMMVTIYALGMNPVIAFPIMMGSCTFSVAISSMQFIKFGQYSRKITLFAATFGVLGVLTGVYFVKGLDVSMLQWVIAVILLYCGISMLMSEIKEKQTTEYQSQTL